jgi:hypothetical protein
LLSLLQGSNACSCVVCVHEAFGLTALRVGGCGPQDGAKLTFFCRCVHSPRWQGHGRHPCVHWCTCRVADVCVRTPEWPGAPPPPPSSFRRPGFPLQVDKSLRQMNGVMWRTREPIVAVGERDGSGAANATADSDLEAAGFDLLGPPGYRYDLCCLHTHTHTHTHTHALPCLEAVVAVDPVCFGARPACLPAWYSPDTVGMMRWATALQAGGV